MPSWPFDGTARIFAFITMLDVIPRLTQRTGTAVHLYGYENMIILGGTLGNILFLFVGNFPVSYVGLAVFGLFSGIFIGCLAMALAESLRGIPILFIFFPTYRTARKEECDYE